MDEETRNDIEESVDEEGRDEAAVDIDRIDKRLDELMDMVRGISSRIEELPTFQQMVDAGAAVVDADDGVDVEAEAPVTTADLSDLDLSI